MGKLEFHRLIMTSPASKGMADFRQLLQPGVNKIDLHDMKTPMSDMVGCKRNYMRSCRGPGYCLGTAGARRAHFESDWHGEQFQHAHLELVSGIFS